eukprot:3051751-Amphidinium_carterae.1
MHRPNGTQTMYAKGERKIKAHRKYNAILSKPIHTPAGSERPRYSLDNIRIRSKICRPSNTLQNDHHAKTRWTM